MKTHNLECLRNYAEFQAVRDEWDEFVQQYFPEKYSRTYAWLSAYWTTYHNNSPALIYLQRNISNHKITAAAPLIVTREVSAGIPILSLQSLGVGIGTDDFLISQEADNFVPAVFNDLVNNQRWHIGRFRRLRSSAFCEEVTKVSTPLGCTLNCFEGKDYITELPASYSDYLQSRTRKFRRNLNQAANRIEKEGVVKFEILDPITDAQRVSVLGREVAATCWQFQEGKSHFNNRGSDTFYDNLVKSSRVSTGEEFIVMLVDDRPVAYLLGCQRDRTYFAVDTAYHADYRHVSVGRLLFGRVIERLIEKGNVDVLDFEGNGEYKDDYATRAHNISCLTIYNRSIYAFCLRLLRESRLVNSLRKIMKKAELEKA